MRALIQRVTSASVIVDKVLVNSIDKGLLIFLGIGKNDDLNDAEFLANKISKLRIFSDNNNKMNCSVQDLNFELLVISQFTLYANCNKGNRPSFQDSEDPKEAEILYNLFVEYLKKLKNNVKTGKFGAIMDIQLNNQGPVTIMLESK